MHSIDSPSTNVIASLLLDAQQYEVCQPLQLGGKLIFSNFIQFYLFFTHDNLFFDFWNECFESKQFAAQSNVNLTNEPNSIKNVQGVKSYSCNYKQEYVRTLIDLAFFF